MQSSNASTIGIQVGNADLSANLIANSSSIPLANSATITVSSSDHTKVLTQPEAGDRQAVTKTTKKASGQTGPKSLAGKKKIGFNALKQGRFAKSPLLPFEDAKLYAKHTKEVFAALGPTNYIETQLVDEYANALWRIYRHETRGSYEREQILHRLTPVMAAQMLGITSERANCAPEFLTQLNHVISKTERVLAHKCLYQYSHLIKNARGIANFNLVWRQFPNLFDALAVWVDKHYEGSPLFNSTKQGLKLAWQQRPEKVLESLERLSNELYYICHWEEFRPQIRVWMESYYFLQRAEQYRINQDEQLLMKERNYAHSLLDRLMRLRKTGQLVQIK